MTAKQDVCIALFRGINVGGRHTLPMRELATLMTDLGCAQVKTYIQSGNVVFRAAPATARGLDARIEAAVEQRFAFRPRVLLLSQAALEEAIRANPFPEAESQPKTLHLSFLAAPPARPELDALAALRSNDERFQLIGPVFYLHAPAGIGKSRLAERIEKCLGVPATARNWRTVLKLQEMAQAH